VECGILAESSESGCERDMRFHRDRWRKETTVMQKSAKKTATLVASALGALALALPVSGLASGARYYNYSERPYYDEGQSRQGWWQNRSDRDDWSEESQDRRRAWNRREDNWSEYQHEKREAKEAARALLHHDD
jgi:hypothetical protein